MTGAMDGIATYTTTQILPEWIEQPEEMGSKEKFWFSYPDPSSRWLFKFTEAGTGQHWAEKIAAEVAAVLSIRCARVEFAEFGGRVGSMTESFARGGRELIHGNQVLAGSVADYNPAKRFHQSDHTVANIWAALDKFFATPDAAKRSKQVFASYIVLDAVIGNNDRHHENWGILRRRIGSSWRGYLAPSFDHASSLGRELRDHGPGKCRERLIEPSRVAAYAANGKGGIFLNESDRHGASPLRLLEACLEHDPDLFRPASKKAARFSGHDFESIVEAVPECWMTPLSRRFAVALITHNLNAIRRMVD